MIESEWWDALLAEIGSAINLFQNSTSITRTEAPYEPMPIRG